VTGIELAIPTDGDPGSGNSLWKVLSLPKLDTLTLSNAPTPLIRHLSANFLTGLAKNFPRARTILLRSSGDGNQDQHL
jgi:hypothetical protein